MPLGYRLQATYTNDDWCAVCRHDHTTTWQEPGPEDRDGQPGHDDYCDCQEGDMDRDHAINCPCVRCEREGISTHHYDCVCVRCENSRMVTDRTNGPNGDGSMEMWNGR